MTTDYERNLHNEILAIRRIVAALDKVDEDTQQRIVRYLVDRYGGEKSWKNAATRREHRSE